MPEEVENSRFTVGYALPQRKLESFMVPPLINHAKQQGIHFIPIDVSTPLTHQGPFHCIIHKLYAHDWTLNLHHYALAHPDTTIIDPPSAIQPLHDRISMLEPVTRLNIPGLGIPNQLLVYDSKTLTSAPNDLTFPVIAKPLLADGTTNAHHMSLVLNREGLTNGLELEAPMVLQQFVNHGGVMFKVYVAGEYVKCVKRGSLGDISEEARENGPGVMGFSQVSSCAVDGDGLGEMPSEEFVIEAAKGLRVGLGLRLFNFDMIRDVKGGGYLVVDINYFPGYEKLPGYECVMTEFFLNINKSQKKKTVMVMKECF